MNTEIQADIQTDEPIVVADKLRQPQKQGPGAKLCHIRNAKGLSLAEVAKKLFLTTTVIEKIEQDDYRYVPGIMFVRGYLRSYAKLLQVDEAAIVTEFDNLALQDTPAPMSIQQVYRRKNTVIKKTLSWLSLVFVVMVVLLLLWARAEFSRYTIKENHRLANPQFTTSVTQVSTKNVTAKVTAKLTAMSQAKQSVDISTANSQRNATLMKQAPLAVQQQPQLTQATTALQQATTTLSPAMPAQQIRKPIQAGISSMTQTDTQAQKSLQKHSQVVKKHLIIEEPFQ